MVKNAVKEKIDIRVFGLAGRVLYFSSVKGMKDVKMNLIHINNGVYFLEIISNEKHYLKRLVKY